MDSFVKNVAVTGFAFGLVNKTTGAAVTTGTVTGYVTLDGGTQTAIAGTPVHKGNGQWSVNLTADEMNGDIVALHFTHSSAVPVDFLIHTTTRVVTGDDQFERAVAVTGFAFSLIDASDGSAITSGTVTGYVLKDGGTQAAIAGTPVHEGSGQWSVDLTASEMDADVIGLLFIHSSAVPVHFTIRTAPAEVESTLTLFCTRADVEFVWSAAGLVARTDDDLNGSADVDLVVWAREAATAKVMRHLGTLYTVAVLQASTWVRWCTAYLAADILGRRAGNPMPNDLQAEVQEYKDALLRIQQGKENLIGDTGPATPRFSVAPTVSNYAVDMRYRRTKVRRVPATSTGSAPGDGIKQNNVQDFGPIL